MFQKFVDTKLFKKPRVFMYQLHDKIQTRNKKIKKMPQAISVVKGDFQTFKLMILKAIDCKSISRKKRLSRDESNNYFNCEFS